ncbi:nucleic acid-binding, OB-fold protein [Vibrio phage 1.017.O._10N.286.55.C11]|nr:nucleic acid-binding, OB-fold protein [Vibrio phage 1.017.O._10N.286.55.C11]AUR85499.1 nucleic acid-binding, OB-fold protein [Vibrio phage 1.075.O._10N.286.55.B10]AUR87045.1 nucleic acid-binding, OB-fold protein [Vibrio phage 1.093.O._10N.286.55.E10]AUR87118.1 nucleic acid-binding, OB-fold protein [Vibrio phage 1.094.O._10N.286.55.E12]
MSKFQLKNVRLSFPSLFKKAEFDGQATKFEATFLMEKDSEQAKMVQAEIDKFLKAKFPNGAPKSIKHTVFVDGDTKDYDGYEGMMAFKGSNNKRPTVIDRDRTPLAEEDDVIYAGCYVNAIVDLWYSDHPKGGKQVLGNVMGVQFVKDGEVFGTDTTAKADDFEVIDDEDF